MRYKFYREHKYVSFVLNDLERIIAKADFHNAKDVELIKEKFNDAINLLKAHAHYEETCLHVLLKQKKSAVYEHVEKDHGTLDATLENLQRLLTKALSAQRSDEQSEAGYQFYLAYRAFVGENLIHLHEEETVILPELQRLYTDQELKKVEAATYKIMTVQEIIEMLQILFPHMNSDDHKAFLDDLRECEPEKFKLVYEAVSQQRLIHRLAVEN